jgi:hypothetical protein
MAWELSAKRNLQEFIIHIAMGVLPDTKTIRILNVDGKTFY